MTLLAGYDLDYLRQIITAATFRAGRVDELDVVQGPILVAGAVGRHHFKLDLRVDVFLGVGQQQSYRPRFISARFFFLQNKATDRSLKSNFISCGNINACLGQRL